MALYDGSGTSYGSGGIQPLDAERIRIGSSVIVGQGSLLSPSGGVLYLGSARSKGLGLLLVESTLDGSGTALGTSSGTVNSERIRNYSSTIVFQGTSTIIQEWPLVSTGRSIFSVGYSVQTFREDTQEILYFSWNHLFQRGDLQLYLCDDTGPILPVSISYRMFYVLPCGARQAAGPDIGYPAQGKTGEFYVTGYAGEFGQPGNWVIRWTIQRNFYDPLEYVEQCFIVTDVNMRARGLDQTSCCSKSGWS